MKMVCDACGHTAPPADVWIHGDKVALECAGCGELARVQRPSNSAASDTEAPPPGGAPRAPQFAVAAAPGLDAPADALPPRDAEDDAACVVPAEPAVSPQVQPVQCAKCGARQTESESCHRCGFSFANYRQGEMAWEVAPEGRAEAWQEAERRWTAALAAGTRAGHEAFIAYCIENDIEDFAGRRLRFRVADRPDDAHAQRQLDLMIERGRTRYLSRLETVRDDTIRGAHSTRRTLFWVVFAVGVALALLFLSLYPNLLM